METDTNAPIVFENCICDAEEACLRKLCDILGLAYGVTAFAGIKSDKAVECAVFDIGRPEDPQVFGFTATSFYFKGQVDLFSRNRKQIQRWVARLMQAMPIQTAQATRVKMPEGSNVEQFRITANGMPVNDITTVDLPVGSEEDGKTVEVFTTAVFFDIIFTTGTRVSA